ncbi:MAG: hypothetical protein Q9211_006580, partial [Gyalolechia sp. 1 TL-2023]
MSTIVMASQAACMDRGDEASSTKPRILPHCLPSGLYRKSVILHCLRKESNKVFTKPVAPALRPRLICSPTSGHFRDVSEGIIELHQKQSKNKKGKTFSGCPVTQEFRQAKAHHPVLTSTGCTTEFCQAGRAVHTDEPRIGENRAIAAVEQEAEGFLRELYRENFFNTKEAFTTRLKVVVAEIRAGACEGKVRETNEQGIVGGNWRQTPAELEFGIRRAWRNARKCIMRSHCEELKLCDLRNLTSSAQMARELVQHMGEAFNNGNVQPTAFVFPPRKINSRGPMIWNHQLLEFAGYEMEDGSILGDPVSVALTNEMIEIGWEPPSPRTRWDLLPLVVMAEDDAPVMMEVPSPLSNLVKIQHPRYFDEFKRLDLRWVAAPALTRLGFDIGGVQYTAAPFLGWFMDAEIGARDLADTVRYNTLPDVARALGLLDGLTDGLEGLEDLPEYERLSILTRAQTELTYAVNWSYQQARVSMSDTLTASMKWCRYDDDFKAKNGFRLPADPYWLAPPQGSIVPVWHRGGAPNYQPKPMICKHVQDPLKAWGREKRDDFVAMKTSNEVAIMPPKRPSFQGRSTTNDCYLTSRDERHLPDVPSSETDLETQKLTATMEGPCPAMIPAEQNRLSISVYFCSAGTFAEKLAVKLHSRLSDMAENMPNVCVRSAVKTLNKLHSSTIRSNDLILAVVSSTGQGEVPPNGSQFIEMCDEHCGEQLKRQSISFRYAIYGNGDSRYSATYNGAAVLIDHKFRGIGGLPLTPNLYQGDTALHVTALQALNPWWTKLQPTIRDLAANPPKIRRMHSDHFRDKDCLVESFNPPAEARLRVRLRFAELRNDHHGATVVQVSPPFRDHYLGTYLVTLNIGDRSYEDLTCIQLLPVNSPAKVRRALRALGVGASDTITLRKTDSNILTYSTFLSEYIDLELSFLDLGWLAN